MSEKVKLPKDVCDALDVAKNDCTLNHILVNTARSLWLKDAIVSPLNDVNLEIIMRALVLGYEPELTPEEQLKFMLTKQHNKNIDYKCGAWYALKIHGIHYDWLEGDAE